MKGILVLLNKTLKNYDVLQSFLMKGRALRGGTNFYALGYHGGNRDVQWIVAVQPFDVKLNGADCM